MITNWFSLPFFKSETHFDIIDRVFNDGKRPLPDISQLFNALVFCPASVTQVVILGQDPYPTPGHAHGLAFSVQEGVWPLPRSLQNIFKELVDDLGVPYPSNGSLLPWAQQGVLLLNTCLTVEAHQPGSHIGQGWEQITKEVLSTLSDKTEHKVFILWGRHAQNYEQYIDASRHLVLKSPHPSPLSAHYGFFGSKPFSKTNAYLTEHSISPIDWELPHGADSLPGPTD